LLQYNIVAKGYQPICYNTILLQKDINRFATIQYCCKRISTDLCWSKL